MTRRSASSMLRFHLKAMALSQSVPAAPQVCTGTPKRNVASVRIASRSKDNAIAFAHPRVRSRRGLGIEDQLFNAHRADGKHEVQALERAAFDALDKRRHRSANLADVDFPCLDGGRPGIGFGDDAESNALQIGRAAPRTIVADNVDFLTGIDALNLRGLVPGGGTPPTISCCPVAIDSGWRTSRVEVLLIISGTSCVVRASVLHGVFPKRLQPRERWRLTVPDPLRHWLDHNMLDGPDHILGGQFLAVVGFSPPGES